MSKRTYHLQAQRLEAGKGYVSCESYKACRFVIIETTTVPATRGRPRQHLKRNLQIFTGPSAEVRGTEALAHMTGRTNPKPSSGVYARSLTRREYDDAVAAGKIPEVRRSTFNEDAGGKSWWSRRAR